jgi:hypothetical protein
VRDGLLAEAAELGLEGDARFDWLVDRALSLPGHVEGEGEAGAPPPPRPEFGRLFTKLRIGKTRFTYLDPATGEEVSESVVRCTGCHAAEPMLADQPVGYRTSSELLDSLHRMAVATARAERTLLAARRGGVSVREAEAELDQAVDDQIELQVLVHTFDAGEDGAFAAKRGAGLERAEAALAGARRGLAELAYRRRGLAVSLGIVLLVLVGLAIKIRRLPP